MVIGERLRSFLREEGVRSHYHVLPHRERFTAQQIADLTHVPGHELATVVIVRDRLNDPLMVVLPAGQFCFHRPAGIPGSVGNRN